MTANTETFEQLITGLIDRGVGNAEMFLPPHILKGLRAKLLAHHSLGEMRPAGVGKNFDYQKNAAIRGDVIKWIEKQPEDPFEKEFIKQVDLFVEHLNSSCYTGINDYEFHYAFYDTGSYYKRHLDRFKNDKGRQFSFVIYLNDNWKISDGGKLSLYLEKEEYSIYPTEGRAVFFRSDQTEHEVHPSTTRPRLSIAGWLKKV